MVNRAAEQAGIIHARLATSSAATASASSSGFGGAPAQAIVTGDVFHVAAGVTYEVQAFPGAQSDATTIGSGSSTDEA
jgi:hypothetical protein